MTPMGYRCVSKSGEGGRGHRTTGGGRTYADNVEFVVGDATLWIATGRRHRSPQRAPCSGSWNAVLRHVTVMLGGDVVQPVTSVRFCGAGGDAELLGYDADDGRHLESRGCRWTTPARLQVSI